MSDVEIAPLAAGPFAPATHGVARDQTFFSLDAQAGRPAVLLFAGNLPLAEQWARRYLHVAPTGSWLPRLAYRMFRHVHQIPGATL